MAAKRAATPATTGMLLDFAADEEVELQKAHVNNLVCLIEEILVLTQAPKWK